MSFSFWLLGDWYLSWLSSSFKQMPCGLCFLVSDAAQGCCEFLFTLCLRRCCTADPHAAFCHSMYEENIWGSRKNSCLFFFPHSLLVSLSYNLAVSCVAQTIWESDNSAHAVPGLEEQFMEWLLRHKVINPVNLTDKCMHASVYLAHRSLLIKLYNQKSLPRDQLLYHFYMPVFFGFFDWAIMLYYFILYLLELYWPPAVMQSSKCHL